MCFGKFDTFGLIGFSRNFLLLILGLMCAYRLLFLALVLSTLSYASYSEGDINMTSLRGLIEAISLVKSVRNVF